MTKLVGMIRMARQGEATLEVFSSQRYGGEFHQLNFAFKKKILLFIKRFI